MIIKRQMWVIRELILNLSQVCTIRRKAHNGVQFFAEKPAAPSRTLSANLLPILTRNYFSLTVRCQKNGEPDSATECAWTKNTRKRFFLPFCFWINNFCNQTKRSQRASVIQIDGSLLDVTGAMRLSMGMRILEKGRICMSTWGAHTIWLCYLFLLCSELCSTGLEDEHVKIKICYQVSSS